MSTDFRRAVDYEPLVGALLRKSREGKIDWRESAEDEAFLASVKGEMTFEVNRRGNVCELIAKDLRGRTVFRFSEPYFTPPAYVGPEDEQEAYMTGADPVTTLGLLHTTARRIALRLDEKLQSSVQLLESL